MIMHLAPGDPATALIGPMGFMELDQGYVEAIKEKYGLNKPILEQLYIYISNALQGDLGYSFTYHRPVVEIIVHSLGNTLLLMFTSYVIGIPIGVLLGAFMARKYPSRVDSVVDGTMKVLLSTPGYWGALIQLLFFSVYLGLFPVGGIRNPLLVNEGELKRVLDILWHLVQPALTLVIFWQIPNISKLTRSSIIDLMNEDFINTARAKGLTEKEVFVRHALRNGLLPVVTMIGLWVGWAFSGALWTETVFSWPGIGLLMFNSITRRDYPIIMGIWIIVSTVTILATLIVDFIYIYLDPRVEY